MVRSSALKTPISTRLIPSVQMTSSKVLGEITKVLQSNEEMPLDQSFTIDIIGVKAPTGSGKSLKVLNYAKDTLIIIIIMVTSIPNRAFQYLFTEI